MNLLKVWNEIIETSRSTKKRVRTNWIESSGPFRGLIRIPHLRNPFSAFDRVTAI